MAVFVSSLVSKTLGEVCNRLKFFDYLSRKIIQDATQFADSFFVSVFL